MSDQSERTADNSMTAVSVVPPDPMSMACSRFLEEHYQLISLLLFVMMLAHEKDETERRLATLLLEKDDLAEDLRRRLNSTAVRGAGAWEAIRTRQQMLLQIVLCRAVDNYLIYLTDLLALIFSSRPETLWSDEKISYKEILQFKSMEDLVGFLAERRVHGLAYKGMRDLANYLSEKLGFKVCENRDDFDRIVLIIELRNLISHNRAVVNRVFKDRQPAFPGKPGEAVILDVTQTMHDVDLLANSICDIEERAAKKWTFPRPVPRKTHDDRTQGIHVVMDLFEAALTAKQEEMANQSVGGNLGTHDCTTPSCETGEST